MRKKIIKTYTGLTLIALVITIIILLILSGISIQFLLGENGLISSSKYAQEEYNKAQIKEDEDLSNLYSSIMIATNDNSHVTISMADLKSLIQEEVKKNSNTAIPTGSIITQMGNTAPSGYLFCNGTEYNIAEYKDLAEYIKEQFGKYNYWGGDGETTFAVPDLRGEFLRCSTENESSGIHTAEGLPNITGSFRILANGSHGSYLGMRDGNGAFFYSNSVGAARDGYTNGYNNNFAPSVQFNAARCSAIYGNSEHVTPNNTSALYCIKY